MRKHIVFILFILILVAFGCTGKEMITKDKTPPAKPVLLPHLGDTGDFPDSVYFNGSWVLLTDDSNGIDAIPDTDGIRLSWIHFLDLDIDLVKIWRFSDFSEPGVIATIPPSQETYTDVKNAKINGDSLYYTYSYFIEVIDKSGNSTLSDTVSYRLLEKQIAHYPANGATVATMDSLNFIYYRSGNVTKFRILLFDDLHNLIWSQNYEGEEQTSYAIRYTGTTAFLPNTTLFWRVDAFEWDSSLNKFIGSESLENTFYVR